MARTTKRSTTKKTPARTKAAPVRRSAPRRRTETAPLTEPVISAAKSVEQTVSRIRFRRSSLILLLAVVIVAALLYYFRSLFIVAMVNGQPVSRTSFEKELEAQSGKQVLNTMITKKLIEEEAAKRHINVTSADVNAQVKTISDSLAKQGRKLDDALAVQGLTEDQLRDQIKYQLMIQKMVKPVKVTDAEVTDYINKNKDALGDNADSDATKKSVHDQLVQQKQNDEVQIFIDNLQKNSKVDYFVKF